MFGFFKGKSKRVDEVIDLSVLQTDIHSHFIPGVDDGSQSMEESISLLKQLKEEMGLSILFISHDLRVVYQMCNHVMIMQKGQFVEMGVPEEIYFAPKNPYTKKLLESAGIE